MDWIATLDVYVFWMALALLVYVYAGYPFVAWLHAVTQPVSHRRAPIEPTVAIIVVAHNEEDRINERLSNLLRLDYPRHKKTIILASDGSTDETVQRARAFSAAGVRVLAFPTRRGKSAVLNDVMQSVRAEIVVFADARQQFELDAVRALVANFADPDIGAVSGELMVCAKPDAAAVGRGVSFYWRYEKFIRRQESRAGSTVGATGAIYAIRRALFTPIPDDTLLDDVLIPLGISRRGYRVIFEPEARAYDCAPATAQQEFVRKVRTIAGTFQLLARERWLLHASENRLWFQTVSHKGLRLLLPVLHLVILIANLALADVAIYRLALAGQLLFYSAALAGGVHRGERRRPAFLNVPYTICLLSWATIVGFIRFVTGGQLATWDRIEHAAHG